MVRIKFLRSFDGFILIYVVADGLDLIGTVAEPLKGHRYGLVGKLNHSAAGQ